MFPNTQQLGYQPASLIGTQSLDTTRQQFVTTADILSTYAPGAISDSNLNTISAGVLGNSTIGSQVNIGQTNTAAYIRLDGINNRIISNDGTTNRIVLGDV